MKKKERILNNQLIIDKVIRETEKNYERWGKENYGLCFGWIEVFMVLILSLCFGFTIYIILVMTGVEPMIRNVMFSLLGTSVASSLLTFRFLLSVKK